MICAQCREETAEASSCGECGEIPLLDGRYALLRVLGQGAHTTTYEARGLEGQPERVAVKELLVRRMQSFKVEQLFQREVDVLRQLSHPAIPNVFEAFTRHRRKLSGLYAVRELVEGQSLADEMAEREYSPAEAARVGAELLDILAYLHGLQPAVAHRDVTPANVLRREDGTLALIDFGSVKESVMPEGSTVSGTYGYMAPEGLMGRALPASDVYSVGALIVALCAGRSAADLLDARARLDVGAHIQHRPLARLVRRMLAPSPERRPGDPAALARRLRQVASKPGGSTSRSRIFLSILAGSFIALGLGAALSASDPEAEEELPRLAAAPSPTAPRGRTVEPDPEPAVRPTVPPITRPAPPEGFRSACAEAGTCRSLDDGFLGSTLSGSCAGLVPAGSETGVTIERVSGRETTSLAVGDRTFTCRAEQQLGRFCNVLCTANANVGEVDALVQWIGDRFDAPRQVLVREPSPNLYAHLGIPSLPGERSWWWGTDPELLLSARFVSARSLTLNLSYRGRSDVRR